MRVHIVIALVISVMVLGLQAQMADSSRECAICHLSWMPTFLDENRDADLISLPEGPMVHSEDVCFSCHDGSILDSRSRVFLEHGHRTGVPLTEDMPIPDGLPLTANSEVQCTTCHTAHGVDPRGEDGQISFFMRAPNENAELCMACHSPQVDDLAGRNHPIGVDLEGDWPTELAATHAEQGHDFDVTCQSCHTPHGQRDNHLLVLPTQQSALCTPCHTDHVPNTDGLWPTGHPIDVAVGSNADMLESMGIHFEENGELGCLSCHSTHQGQADAGILIADNSRDAMCLLCHEEKFELRNSMHHLASTAPDVVNATGRPAGSAGSCSGCHVPHGAQGPMLWAREINAVAQGEAALCLSCHGETHADNMPALTGTNHPTGIALPSGMSSGRLPLYDEALHPSADGDLVCSTCHTVHSDGVGGGLRGSNANDQLCQTCHTDEWATVADGAHAMDSHQGVCSTCHAPHHGTGPRLWAQELGEGDSPAEQMCASCHGDPHWADAASPTNHMHPTFGVLGDSESTGLPLFDRQTGDRAANGEMTCLTCHDAHHLPDESGASTRLAQSDESPLCQECHTDQSQILRTDHDEIRNAQQGICANCHRFLGSEESGWLYAANQDIEDGDAITSTCIACHDSTDHNLMAHPMAEASDLESLPSHLPLFDESGHRFAEGHMNCATCHEVHGMGEEDEFLRLGEGGDPSLCIDCHRDQAAVVGTDHDLQQIFGGATVCTSCHTAHPEGDHSLLWAGPLGQGNTFMERTCTGCHRSNGEARPVPSDTAIHPPDAVMFWADDTGPIDCGTCHDAHHWGQPSELPSDEGTIMNSFLRSDVAAEVCAECHGRDAMVRHLLFHHGQRWGRSALHPQEGDQ